MAVTVSGPSRASRWRPRPIASWSIRVAVFVLPVTAGFVTSLLISRALPRPHDLASDVLWWAALIAAVLAVVIAATAACRRFLPLAALFELSLLFPDRAPSRFALARQTGSSRHLARQVEALRDDPGVSDSLQVRRAEQILSLVAAL